MAECRMAQHQRTDVLGQLARYYSANYFILLLAARPGTENKDFERGTVCGALKSEREK